LVSGKYRTAAPNETVSFRAGSYSSYNYWREQLAAVVGTTTAAIWNHELKPVAFGELIDFADNEGTIGPKTSAKLAKDFAQWEARVEEHAKMLEDGAEFMKLYRIWRLAFATAARGGAVKFH
jgi:hypothetical protein